MIVYPEDTIFEDNMGEVRLCLLNTQLMFETTGKRTCELRLSISEDDESSPLLTAPYE